MTPTKVFVLRPRFPVTRIFTSSNNKLEPTSSASSEEDLSTSNDATEANEQLVRLGIQGGLVVAAVGLVYGASTTLLGLVGGLIAQAGTAVTDEVLREAGNVISWIGVLLLGIVHVVWQAANIVVPALWQALVALVTWAAPMARTTAETVVAPALNEAAEQFATAAAPFVDQASTTISPYVESARTTVDSTVMVPLQGVVEAATNTVTNMVDETLQSASASVDASFQSATESLQSVVQKGFSSSE